jgi:membrane protein implicated in regulation of membrane protease activity
MAIEISIYLIIAIICLVFLIVSVALGGFGDDLDMGGHDVDVGGDFDVGGADVDAGFDAGHGDFSGAGISPLSLPIIMAFGTTFGGVGALLEQANFGMFMTPIIAIFVSIIMAAALYFALTWLFIKTQATSSVSMRNLIGEQGTVSVAIKKGKMGQIIVVTEERGRTLLSAVADEPIPQDTIVEIKAIVGNGVRVERK